MINNHKLQFKILNEIPLSYVALARGGVNSQHVLILPIQHHQSSLTIPDDVAAEVEEYKKSLREMFKSRGLTTFVYERNYKTDHMQIQLIPIHKKYKACDY